MVENNSDLYSQYSRFFCKIFSSLEIVLLIKGFAQKFLNFHCKRISVLSHTSTI